jgi:hypothetical protein
MAGALTISTLNNDTGVLQAQNGMNGIAKAWVNWNGDTGVVNGSFNVSSVTLVTASANWIINYTTAMPNANYAVALGTTSRFNNAIDGRQCVLCVNRDSLTTTSVQIYSFNCVSGANGESSGKLGAIILGT